MKWLVYWLLVIPAAAAPTLADETLPPGRHPGTMRVPGIPHQDMELVVTRIGEEPTDDGALLYEIVTENRSFELDDVTISKDSLEFSFEPGFEVECELEAQPEGSFDGECGTDDDDEPRIRLTVAPQENIIGGEGDTPVEDVTPIGVDPVQADPHGDVEP